MIERDCANCKHHTSDGCSKWDCEFEKAMTREETIKTLEVLKLKDGGVVVNLNDAIDMAIEALSADAVQEWIPVSNGLPSESGNYLITVADLRLWHNGEHTVTMADFYAKTKKWDSIVDVYAWMPLPKPYKGGDTE